MTVSRGSVQIAFVAALGGFLLGFDATVIAGTLPFLRHYYFGPAAGGGDVRLGIAISCLEWGAMIGNLSAGKLADRYGRRTILQVTAALFLASSILAATSRSYAMFVAARIIGGLGVGSAILIAPMYIAEIAPPGRRGMLVSVNQLMIVIGIAASSVSNWLLLPVGQDNWRWMLGIEAVPAIAFLLLLARVPESPRWLVLSGREERAREVMRTLGEPAADEQYDALRASIGASRTSGFGSLRDRGILRVLVFCIGLGVFQQVTGINAVFYYLPVIFTKSTGSVVDAFWQTVVVGVVNVLMTLLAMRFIDRLGRRPLLLIGGLGMAASLLTISAGFERGSAHAWLVLPAVIGYVASFAVSFGPIVWVLVSELFPNRSRAIAISVVGFCNSLSSAVVTFLFPWQFHRWGASDTFLGYAILAISATVFVARYAPETRGRTLEEIEQSLRDGTLWGVGMKNARSNTLRWLKRTACRLGIGA